MNIQNEIDRYLSDKGDNLRTITLRGLSGDIVLPGDCYLALIGCTVRTAKIGPNCIFVVEQSKLQGDIALAEGCTLTVDASAVTGAIAPSGCKGTFKNCQFDKTIDLVSSSFEIFACAFAGSATGIKLDKGSKATVRGCSFSSKVGVIVAGDSQLNCYNVNFSTQQECIHATTGTVNYFGGLLNSSGGTCIRGEKNSKIVVSGIASASGQIGVINIDTSSVMQVHNSGSIDSQNNAIVVSGAAKLELYQIAKLTSTQTTIRVDTKGEITISEVPLIHSTRAESLYINNGSMFGRELGIIRGTTSAFVSQNSALVRILGFEEIRADKKVCINSGDLDTYELTKGALVQADLDDIIAGTNGKFTFRDVDRIRGVLKGGIVLGHAGQIDIFNTKEFTAVKKATAQVGDGGQILFSFCEFINAEGAGDTITLGKNGFLRMTDCGKIASQKQTVVTAGVGTSVEIVSFDTIQSVKQHALDIDGCNLVLRNGKQVLGGDSGAVKIGGTAGTANIEQIQFLDGGKGEAVFINNGVIDMRDCPKVTAGSNAIHFATGTVASLVQVKDITGGQDGVKLENGSLLTMSGTDSLQAVEGISMNLDSSEADLLSVKKIVSSNGPLSVNNGSKISVRGSSLNDGNILVRDSELHLLSCTIKKSIESTNSVIDMDRCDVQGEANAITQGIFDARNCNFKGGVTFDRATIKEILVTHEDIVTLTNSAGLFLSCQGTSWINNVSGLQFIGCGGTVTNATPGSYINVQKGGLIDIKGLVVNLGESVNLG